MTIADETQVHEVLDIFNDRICAVYDRAWQDWLKSPNRGRYLYRRSRAAEIFDNIARQAYAEFSEDKDVHIISKNQTIKILFKDSVLVRFKKANSSGLGANISTQAVMQFIDPEHTIPGLLKQLHKVEVCYALDDLQTRMQTITVTARDKYRKIWGYELVTPTAGAEVVGFPAAIAPPNEVHPPQVHIRKPIADNESK